MIRKTLAATFLMTAPLAFAGPAAAQETGGDRINMVIAYDEDECPEAQGDEIVICEILVEAERYRIPEGLRTSDSPQNRAWSRRVERYKMLGAFGTMSCDPAGAGGFTGCTQQMINAAYADRSESSRVRFAQLIEQARAERLSPIDADAAEEQARVEQIAREYMERLERERQQALPGEQPLPDVVETEEPASSSEPQPE